MNVTDLTDEEQFTLAKAMWTAAFETTLKTSLDEGIQNRIVAAAMIDVMTMVIKTLLGVNE